MSGPKAVLDEPRTRKKAISMLAKGATKAGVAREVGCARSTVSTWANREEVQEWIEEKTKKYLESLPDALEMSKNIITAGKRESEKLLDENPGTADGKTLDLATREGEQLRKSAGLTPTPNQVTLIQNIYSDKRSIYYGGVVGELLRKHFGAVEDQGQGEKDVDTETANHPLTGTDDGEEV
jgi:transposase-like protein